MIAIMTASVTLTVVAAGVYTDVRSGKILNSLTVPAIALGLILNTADGHWAGLLVSGKGIAVGLGLFVFSTQLGRILGGGDIKLLMAVGALQGPTFLLHTIAATALIGGVLAIAIALYRRMLLSTLRSLVTGCYLRLAHRIPMQIEEDSTGPRIHYAVAIALGTIIILTVFNLSGG